MANIGDLVVNLDANTARLEAGLDRATKATGRYRDAAGRMREANGRFVSSANLAGAAMGNAAKTTSRAASGFSKIAGESQRAVPPLKQMTSALGGISAALVARSVIRYADAWNNAGNQLRQVTDTASELANVQETLMGVANDTRSEFESTANLYSRLARSTTEMGLSQKELIGLTKTINQSFAVSGATAGEAAAAITQLSQGLAAGALRGDEFNSVSEQAPALMRAIAESLDMTIGELREFAAEGGITAEIVVKALQESADAIENNFGKAVATFGQQMTVARNNMLQFVGGSNDVNEALGNIGGAAVSVSENVDKLMNVLIALGGVIAGRLVGRIIALGLEMRTAAGAATALKGAMAFLGGPAGIAIAVTVGIGQIIDALGLMRDHSQEAKDSVSLLNDELAEMNANSIDAALIEINSRMFELQKNAENARKEIEALNNANNTPGPFRNSMAQGVGAEERRELLDRASSADAERGALSERAQELQEMRNGLGKAGEAATETASKLMQTNEQAGRLTDTAIKSATELAKHGESSRKATESVDNFANAAQGAATRMASIAQSRDPRYGFDPDEGTASSRARARFEASANRVGSPQVMNLGGNPDAKRTWSTAAYDAAGSAPSMGKAANEAMQSTQQGNGKNLGTLKLASEKGGTIDVEANSDRLQSWLANTLSGNAAAS